MQEMPTASLRLRPLPSAAAAAAASTLQKTTMDPPGLAAASSFDADASQASSSHGSKSTALSPGRGRKASDASAPGSAGGSAGGTHGGGDRQAFLYSLYDILSMPHARTPVSGVPYETIVSWLPHGRGFVIGDKPRFETEVLPAFLPHTKYASFTRRLKRWKFVRVSSGIEMGSYYHPHFQRGKPHLVHLINTTDAPAGRESLVPSYAAYPSGGSDEASQGKKRGGGGGGDRRFAAICNPYAGLGAEEGLGLDDDDKEEEEEPGKKKRKTKAADEDVQDFPQLMRKISKVKRQENAAARRRREAIRSGSGGLDPSTAMGMGAMSAMGAGYAPYPSLTTGVNPMASGMMPMGGMGGMGSGFMAMTPRYPQPPAAEVAVAAMMSPMQTSAYRSYPQPPAAEVADAMMSQMQSSAYRSQYHPSAEAQMMMGLGEGGLGGGLGGGATPGAWNPALAGTASQREASWRQPQAESGMGGMYGGSSDAMAAASTDGAMGTFASKLPPSPSPTPPMGPDGDAHYPGYSSQASAGMYGGEGTLSDAERMWMLRREQEQMLQRELMMRKQDPSGKRD